MNDNVPPRTAARFMVRGAMIALVMGMTARLGWEWAGWLIG
ncbi:MAG TPA: hypothetical protein VFY63_05465 [Pseudorhizobium sp.]|nr:hypothetical protein [Pseudorhizobium sp.]